MKPRDGLLTFAGPDVCLDEIFPPETRQMLIFINTEDENRNYPMLDISDMLYEDDEFDDEFADEFDELFENVSYLYYEDDSEEMSREERKKRVLH